MACLVDTNVLLRLAVPAIRATSARAALSRQWLRKVSTSPARTSSSFGTSPLDPVENNGLGQTILAADQVLKDLEQAFSRLPEPADLYDHWRELVVRFGVSGVKVHDARLIALMLANDIVRILTFNSADFRRYETLGIRAIDPGEI